MAENQLLNFFEHILLRDCISCYCHGKRYDIIIVRAPLPNQEEEEDGIKFLIRGMSMLNGFSGNPLTIAFQGNSIHKEQEKTRAQEVFYVLERKQIKIAKTISLIGQNFLYFLFHNHNAI